MNKEEKVSKVVFDRVWMRIYMLWEECRRSNEKWISTIIKEEKLNVNVAKTGYVGLSIATLLAQHRHVTVVDIIEDKVNFINN